MLFNHFLFVLLLLAVTLGAVLKKKLTNDGAVTAAVIGCCIYAGAGFAGISMIGLFFLLGILATSWKINTKEKLGAAETDKGRRKASQVLANGGVAALLGLCVFFLPAERSLFIPMMAASLSAATADTMSSELGTLYGKRFYNILNFQKDRRGENGVVSLEGTLFGIAGSALIGIVHACFFGWDQLFVWIILAGTFGNFIDSVLGATLERRRYMGNDAVNFLNTLAAALMALSLNWIF